MNPIKVAGAGVSRQRGITMMGGLMILIFMAFVVVIVMKVVPIYLNYYQIYTALEGLQSEPGIKSESKNQIMERILRRFDISQIYSPDPKDVIKIEKKGGVTEVKLAYEDRRGLLGNLEVVAVFEREFILQ